MTTLKRAFIAIDLPAPVVDELGEFVRVLKKRVEGFRWVKLEPLHLTLGRARGRVCNLTRAMSEQRQFMGGPWRAKSLVLYESELLGGGAKHIPRAEYKLDRT